MEWVRWGKEEGDSGYGVFGALSETPETEWSRLLLTYARTDDFESLPKKEMRFDYLWRSEELKGQEEF